MPSSRNSAAPTPTNLIWFKIGLKDAETRQKFKDNLLLWMDFGSLPFWLIPLNTRFSLSSYLLLYHLLNVLITGTTSFKITRLLLYLNRKTPHKPPSDSQLYDSLLLPDTSARRLFGCSGGALAARNLQPSDTVLYTAPRFLLFLPFCALDPLLFLLACVGTALLAVGVVTVHLNDLEGKLSPGSILLPHLYYSPWLQTLPPLLCSC